MVLIGCRDLAQHLAARLGHDGGDVALQRIAEGVVGGEEEPVLAARLDDRRAGAVGERGGVVDPLHGVGIAELAGDVGRGRIGGEEYPLLLAGDALDGDRRGRGAGAQDHVDLLVVVPAAGEGGGDVGLVLDVAGDELDLLAEDRAAEIVDRHLRGDHGTGAVDVGVEARHVGGDADLDHVVRELRPRRRCPRRQHNAPTHPTHHASSFRSHGLFGCVEPSKVMAWPAKHRE